MFANGFFTITIGEVVGLMVTVIGIWLVVKQLAETKKATQLEGTLGLVKMGQHYDDYLVLREVVLHKTWKSLSLNKAHSKVMESERYSRAFGQQLIFFETLGVLVKRGLLERGIAKDIIGPAAQEWWIHLEKVINKERLMRIPEIAENWEWLAKEFE